MIVFTGSVAGVNASHTTSNDRFRCHDLYCGLSIIVYGFGKTAVLREPRFTAIIITAGCCRCFIDGTAAVFVEEKTSIFLREREREREIAYRMGQFEVTVLHELINYLCLICIVTVPVAFEEYSRRILSSLLPRLVIKYDCNPL